MHSVVTKTLLCSICAGLVCVLTQCATSPTGRTQLKLFPDSEIASMGVAAYDEIKTNTPISKDTQATAYVNCVADAIIRVVPTNTRWEVNLFQDDAINAFALPGGKIGVYTGLLKVTENQDQLAAVIGHEIGHVIADHSNARVSTAFATKSGLQLLQVMAGGASGAKSQLFGLLGVGAQVGILLPYGRSQESESDILGLRYMSEAGFDPRASIKLWQNMAKASGGEPPQFLSTHPSSQQRINDLRANMPNALKIYDRARANNRIPRCGN